jgi:hypothetical protein
VVWASGQWCPGCVVSVGVWMFGLSITGYGAMNLDTDSNAGGSHDLYRTTGSALSQRRRRSKGDASRRNV